MVNKILNFIFGVRKIAENKGFLEYSAREQKRIIRSAAKGANKLQRELVEEYKRKYGNTDPNSFTSVF